MALNTESSLIANFDAPGGLGHISLGPNIASATTISPTFQAHHVTGTAAIDTITVPWPGFTGPIWLFADGAWTWTTNGNIQTSGTTTTGNQVPVIFYFDGSKWQPSRLS